jgi:diketogulonate reductase-like aldo/keto reductase
MPFNSVADMPSVGLGLWKIPKEECAEVSSVQLWKTSWG